MNETTGSLLERCGETPARDWVNVRWLLGAILVWAVLFVGGAQLLKRGLLPDGPISWLVATLPLLALLAVFVAFARFLRETDELHRVIQLRAVALAFAGGWLAITGYAMVDKLGVASIDGIDLVTLTMATTYAVASLWGWRRYL